MQFVILGFTVHDCTDHRCSKPKSFQRAIVFGEQKIQFLSISFI